MEYLVRDVLGCIPKVDFIGVPIFRREIFSTRVLGMLKNPLHGKLSTNVQPLQTFLKIVSI